MLRTVHVSPLAGQRDEETIEWSQLASATQQARDRIGARTIWNVNSTATGGGVAEMLVSILAHARGAGLDMRWVVMDADSEFFTITKRLHHRFHGSEGDGEPLGPEQDDVYRRVTARNARELSTELKPGDVVFLNDPQTAGMVPILARCGVHIVWRSHIGTDRANAEVEEAWQFLLPYLREVDAFVFSRWDYVPPQLADRDVTVIAPAIDIFAEKNIAIDDDHAAAILAISGLCDGETTSVPLFYHADWRADIVTRAAEMDQDEPAPLGDRLIVQVSRWDPLKEPIGVMRGFTDHVAPVVGDVRLMLAGPSPEGVSDDPEAAQVLEAVRVARADLDPAVRRRVHLACLPAQHHSESAAMVNALQRHATIVVQKSLAEGFGLTVSEAMWKRRPVVASRVGGIQDQIDSTINGVLIDDPTDLPAFGAAVVGLLADPVRAAAIGDAAHDRVRTQFLGSRQAIQLMALTVRILGR